MSEPDQHMTCWSRVNDWGPQERKEGLDEWRKHGPDRSCSFCGSMHPDDFLSWCLRVVEPDSDVEIDLGKPGKFYVRRKGATDTSIKFYSWHFQTPFDPSPEEDAMIRKALEVSQVRTRAHVDSLMRAIRRQPPEP